MSYTLENMSEGLQSLVDGYIDYSKEVILGRALPNLYDGLKVVNRRILYTAKLIIKGDNKMKSANLAGQTMAYHPHGDAAIYDAMVLLTDNNGSLTIPLLTGQGNFGSVTSRDLPAAARYTEVKLHPNAEEYFKDMRGIDLVPNYDSTSSEPAVLPVTYPAILCGAQQGIAVGFACKIPSFNFNDVIDLTVEYLREGKCKTVICPDFVTGGYIVKNNKELDKLMRIGKGSFKLRAKISKTGKELTVYEFPYGTKIDSLVQQIRKANISGVSDVGDITDFKRGSGILIDTQSKAKTDEVQLALFRDTDLQCNYSANIMVIDNDEPVCLGVWSIIERWVKWRRGIVKTKLTRELEDMKLKARQLIAFNMVFDAPEKKEEMLNLVLHNSDQAAVQYLMDNFDNEYMDAEMAKWIISRRVNVFRTGAKYKEQYNSLVSTIVEYENNINNIDEYLIKELTTLKANRGHMYPRRTEITNTDYEFVVSDTGELQKDYTPCTYYLKDGFLRKLRADVEISCDYKLNACACDVLVALDNRGRVLRIYCEDLPYNSVVAGAGDMGTYIPRYCGLNETDDYRITWLGVLSDEVKMLLYKDGNVGFLDMSEWTGVNRRVKVIEKGISVSSADTLGAVIDIPECLFVMDSRCRLGVAYVSEIKRKDRTAKTRVFNPAKNEQICYYATMTLADTMSVLNNASRYTTGKLMYLENADDFASETTIFTPMN